jgi:hypothetical protein
VRYEEVEHRGLCVLVSTTTTVMHAGVDKLLVKNCKTDHHFWESDARPQGETMGCYRTTIGA